MTRPLFPLTSRIGDLPTGARFIYDGWGDGTVTANDGRIHLATISVEGRQVATVEALYPGEEVQVA